MSGDFFNKVHHIQSLVQLFHIHGSVGLYEPIEERFRKSIVIVGARGLCIMHEMTDLMGMTEEIEAMQKKGVNGQPSPKRDITDEEQSLLERGCIRLGNENKIWYQPIFVTPSQTKPEYKSWYVSILRKLIHSKLPHTEKIIVAGYSFPPADFEHLKSFFVPEVIPEEAPVMCINLENEEDPFRKKAEHIFPRNNIDFSVKDFKEYCKSLHIK